jgi:hypothetical protein
VSARAKTPPCRRGHDHAALKDDAATWSTLRFVGFVDLGEDGMGEMRDCPCGSSITRPAEDQAAARTWWEGYSAGYSAGLRSAA